MAGIYTRFPSITSTRSSAVAPGCLMATSALLSLYSLRTALISSWSMFVSGTVLVIAIPPLSFLRTVMFGGFLLSRIPKPSSSASIMALSLRGLRTSRTMKMSWQVRATCEESGPESLGTPRDYYVELTCNDLSSTSSTVIGTFDNTG